MKSIITIVCAIFCLMTIISQPVKAEENNYIVQPNDTLWKIATRLRVDCKVLYHLNKSVIGIDPNLIFTGQRLKIPTLTKSTLPKLALGQKPNTYAFPKSEAMLLTKQRSKNQHADSPSRLNLQDDTANQYVDRIISKLDLLLRTGSTFWSSDAGKLQMAVGSIFISTFLFSYLIIISSLNYFGLKQSGISLAETGGQAGAPNIYVGSFVRHDCTLYFLVHGDVSFVAPSLRLATYTKAVFGKSFQKYLRFDLLAVDTNFEKLFGVPRDEIVELSPIDQEQFYRLAQKSRQT